MLVAKDLMTQTAIMAGQDMSVTELANLLRKERIGGVPVVNHEKKICGIVTVTDIFNAVAVARNLHPNEALWIEAFHQSSKSLTVKDIYTHQLISVLPETPVEAVFELMIQRDIHTIPVMDKDSTQLFGVIGRHDVTWAVFGKSSE